MKKKIRFIINPKSGTRKKNHVPELINQLVDRNKFDFEISLTEAPKQATILSREAALNGYDIVVAVGGDGSANEVAKGLEQSDCALGIIPMGSGNGMARHLRIPVNVEKAMNVINTGKKIKIDTVRVNEEFCLGTMGVGFDGYIAHLFAASSKRGYSTYVKLVLKEFYSYKPKMYEITVDGETVSKECFLLTFANSSQFGNDAVIAPFANVRDGIVDVSMIRKFSVRNVPALIYRLMHNSIHRSKFFSMMSGKNIALKNNSVLKGHIDGEPVTFDTDLHIKIRPESLNVIVPAN